jgi:release factor glutamine methyltransferase
MRRNRTYLHAHDDELLDPRIIEIANARLDLRLDRVPIAYIIGHKEFYGRRFNVNTATLIPRPESETLIDILSEMLPKNETLFPIHTRLVDVGTGSGNLGITAKLEHPELDVTLVDISTQALSVATRNAKQLHADVTTLKSDLLKDYPFEPNIVLANLPYVDTAWERSPETNYEPQSALFAADGGMALIKTLVTQSSTLMSVGGILILELDPVQHDDIIKHASNNHFKLHEARDYCLAFTRTD